MVVLTSCFGAFCTHQHTQEAISQHPLEVPQVPYANKWMRRMTEGGSLPTEHVGASATATVAASTAVTESSDIVSATFTPLHASEWTLSNDYCCTLHAPPSPNAHETLRYDQLQDRTVLRATTLLQNTTKSVVRVEIAQQSGIDLEMLMRRDLPILFYDEITLFEVRSQLFLCKQLSILTYLLTDDCVLQQDDLEDCGEVSFDAKIRVMPTCWFILSKLFVRIDDVIVRCRETRLYHNFNDVAEDGSLLISMDVTWREKRLQPEGPAGNSSRRSSKYVKGSSNELPLINDKVGIAQTFTLRI
jgi:hypothetical protein